MRLFIYRVEVKISMIFRFFGIRYSKEPIPVGNYCYERDTKRDVVEPLDNGGYWIKPCKYYRGTHETGGIACTYVGYFGFDPSLFDSCKICGVKCDGDEN